MMHQTESWARDTGPQPVGLVPLAILGAGVGLIAALICVAVFWMIGLDINAGIVGGAAGAVAGASTALLGISSIAD